MFLSLNAFRLLRDHQIIQIFRNIQSFLHGAEDLHKLFSCDSLTLYQIFGNLIFVSDDVDRYNEEQWRVYNYVIDGEPITVHEAYYLNKHDIYVRYTEKGEEHTLIFDVDQGEVMKSK